MLGVDPVIEGEFVAGKGAVTLKLRTVEVRCARQVAATTIAGRTAAEVVKKLDMAAPALLPQSAQNLRAIP